MLYPNRDSYLTTTSSTRRGIQRTQKSQVMKGNNLRRFSNRSTTATIFLSSTHMRTLSSNQSQTLRASAHSWPTCLLTTTFCCSKVMTNKADPSSKVLITYTSRIFLFWWSSRPILKSHNPSKQSSMRTFTSVKIASRLRNCLKTPTLRMSCFATWDNVTAKSRNSSSLTTTTMLFSIKSEWASG